MATPGRSVARLAASPPPPQAPRKDLVPQETAVNTVQCAIAPGSPAERLSHEVKNEGLSLEKLTLQIPPTLHFSRVLALEQM